MEKEASIIKFVTIKNRKNPKDGKYRSYYYYIERLYDPKLKKTRDFSLPESMKKDTKHSKVICRASVINRDFQEEFFKKNKKAENYKELMQKYWQKLEKTGKNPIKEPQSEIKGTHFDTISDGYDLTKTKHYSRKDGSNGTIKYQIRAKQIKDSEGKWKQKFLQYLGKVKDNSN